MNIGPFANAVLKIGAVTFLVLMYGAGAYFFY